MARFFVVEESSGERMPFLRGILVQSLVATGLPFQDAYSFSQTIRKELGSVEAIGSDELRVRVIQGLARHFGPEVAQAYERGPQAEQQILVRLVTGEQPFSVGLLTQKLQACAISRQEAWEVAQQVRKVLQKEGYGEIDHLALRRVIYRVLLEYCSTEVANRYLSWRQFRYSGKPLILLIGGATGTGKSTVATELAALLGVVRTQSTDMMREIIRCYLRSEEAVTLSYSSFEAWRSQPAQDADDSGEGNAPLIEGFLAQFQTIKQGLEATLQRAVKERQDLIVDGVHVVPSQLDLAQAAQEALVVPVMLVVSTRDRLIKRFAERGRTQPARGGASRYVQNLDAIWELQSYLLGEADKAGVPLILNLSVEECVREILRAVGRKVSDLYPPDLESLA